MKDLSIIIPYRNSPVSLLKKLLKSLFSEFEINRLNWEVCIVDDASKIKLDYKNIRNERIDNDKIRIVRLKTHSGIGAARNFGFNLSDGEYITFLDSDDVIVAGGLNRLLCKASQNNLVFGDHIVVPNNGSRPFIRHKNKWKILWEKFRATINNPLLFCNFIVFPFIVHHSTIDSIGGYPNTGYTGEHVLFYGRISELENIELIHIPEVCYEYWQRKDGNSLSNLNLHISHKGKALCSYALEAGFNGISFSGITLLKENDPVLYLPTYNGKNIIPIWATPSFENKQWSWNENYS